MSKSNSFIKRIAVVAAAGVMITSIPMTGCDMIKGEDKTSGSSKSAVEQNSASETKFGGNIAVRSDTYKVSVPVMQYYYNLLYNKFLSTHGSYYFDQSQSLKEQNVPGEENTTWYDYFLEYTKNYMSQTIVFAEAAQAEGKTLSDSDVGLINSNFDEMEKYAESLNMTIDEFITKTYGEGVSKSDIEYMQRMSSLAQSYSNELLESFKYSDDDLEAFYKANKNGFDYADYMTYTFKYSDTDLQGSAINTDENKKKEMKEYADGLAACKTEDEFKAYIEKYLRANPSSVTVTAETSESSITETDFNNAIDEAIEHSYNRMVAYNQNSKIATWVFTDGRKAGETTVSDEDSEYIVALVLRPAYRDDSIYKNVRHILVMTSEAAKQNGMSIDRTDAEAKAAAESIYNEWKNGAATEESFAELAKKYTDDTGSKSSGGLYENVSEGKMLPEFNDWIYDPQRKPGDSGIVKTTYGYHIMYFVSNTDEQWKVVASSAKRQDDLSAKYSELQEKYKVEFDDDAMQNFVLLDLDVQSSEVSAVTSEAVVSD